ncbi:MAG: hypothetical protein KDD29_04165 [Flavobacteriales bacterium]|nr:hypothetical protein [Flavobacteriales bacterium]MCB9335885.1 hypothetical protein [Flavobacteriales bacterium]
MNKYIHILVFLLFLSFIYGCKSDSENHAEGVIEYQVSYPKMEKTNFMLDFMPRKMTMSFRRDIYSTQLTAGMGMFRSSFICDKGKGEFVQMVKLINKKYALQLNEEGIKKYIESQPKVSIEYTNDIKEILGYNCKKAIITLDNDKNDAFTVYYTDQINIETPNWCNEFTDIEGVLLEYQYEKYDVCMRFTASKIHFKEVDDKNFELSNEYKLISEEEMNKEMQEIFDSFN